MTKISYLLIGTQKSGTTSAITVFNSHPDIFMYDGEPHFFDNDNNYSKNTYYYENLLQSDKKFIGEKSPDYCYLRFAIDRIYDTYPNIKLILILREPISRIVSAYNMYCNMIYPRVPNQKNYVLTTYKPLFELINFNEKLENITQHDAWYLQRGFYIEQINYILSKFKREQLYIAISEKIKKNPIYEYNKMFEFIGARKLNENEIKIDFDRIKGIYTNEMTKDQLIKYTLDMYNKRDKNYPLIYTKNITIEEKKKLYDIYKSYNEKLYDFLGYNIEEWEDFYKNIY